MAAEANVTLDVGQIWEDCDYRSKGRQVRIVMIDWSVGTALCVAREAEDCPWHKLGRRISLHRFRPSSTGYRFLRFAREGE